MKIVDLKCPSCGGKLIPMEGNAKIVCCEYCKSQFVLEEDQIINYHIHQYGDSGRQGNFSANTGGDFSPKSAAVVIGVFAVMAAAMISFSVIRGAKEDAPPAVPYTVAGGAVPYSPAEGEAEEAAAPEREYSPLYQQIVEEIFQKSADKVTAQELDSLRYLKVELGSETHKIQYSFDDPYETAQPQIHDFETPALTWDTGDWGAFTGLVKADLGNERSGLEALEKLENLKGLVCYHGDFSSLAQILPAEQIIELDMDHPESLEGAGAFENLEILRLEDVEAPDLKQLVNLKQLKSLSIEEYFDIDETDALTNYGALSVLTSLESLHLKSESIRELSFLKPLSNLTSLSVEDTECLGVEPLGELTQLTSLRLVDNDSVTDYSPLRSLTGLTSLVLDKNTSAEDPDLSPLGNLEQLEISGFLSVAFLGNMGNLKELSIHGCNMDEASALSSLTGLESLTCYSVWTYAHAMKNVSFIDGMANLKRLSFCNREPDSFFSGYGNNVEIYGDISNVFNHPGLEELYLSDCVTGIDFGRIQDNPTLKVLWLNKISVKENFYVESSGGITNVWYDDVSFAEHTDFLTHFPNLEELRLNENQLTDIQFASSLKSLKRLSLQDNYVTDLSPLNQIDGLKYLDVRKNPVSSVPEAEDGMVILQ